MAVGPSVKSGHNWLFQNVASAAWCLLGRNGMVHLTIKVRLGTQWQFLLINKLQKVLVASAKPFGLPSSSVKQSDASGDGDRVDGHVSFCP